MAIRPQSAKAKGRRLQQWWRDKILSALEPFGVVEGDVTSTSMGAGGEDVVLSPFARKLLPISTECKSNKAFSVYNYYNQAKSNSDKFEPVVIIKGDNKKPLAIVDALHYLELRVKLIEKE